MVPPEGFDSASRVVQKPDAALDPGTQTVTLVVEERDPRTTYQPGRHPALTSGRFCRVDIAASKITGAVVIARTALHDGNTVFLAEAGRLAQRQVQVARSRHDEAILSVEVATRR